MTRGIVVKILHYNKITSTCNPVKFQSLKKTDTFSLLYI